jgi:hypothetical protein
MKLDLLFEERSIESDPVDQESFIWPRLLINKPALPLFLLKGDGGIKE